MSGIIGIWNRDGKPVEKTLLDRLNQTIGHRGLDGSGSRVEGPVGLACQMNNVTLESQGDQQPVRHPSGVTLVFDGRLDNREKLISELRGSAALDSGASDSKLILEAYLAFGENLAEHLEGDFAFAVYDPKREKLLLVRDALGVRPLFYTQAGDIFLFGSEIKALLAHPAVSPVPDDDTLADLLNSVYDPELTFFKGIYNVLAAHLVVVSRRSLTKKEYWDFDRIRPLRYSSHEEYVSHFRDLFQQSVKRRLRSRWPVSVSLSGGLDSSSIFCTGLHLIRKGASPCPALYAVSHISETGTPSHEEAFVKDIEKEFGVQARRVPMLPLGLMQGRIREAAWHIETPILDSQWINSENLFREHQASGARVVLTGHWGDQFLFSQGYLVDFFRQLAWHKILGHILEFKNWLTDTNPRMFWQFFMFDLIRFQIPDWIRPVLRRLNRKKYPDWFSKELRQRARLRHLNRKPVKKEFPSVHARALYEEARRGHPVLSMEWENKVANMFGLEIAFPFLDRELLSFLAAIPGPVMSYQGVPKSILRKAMQGLMPQSIVERRWKADMSHLVNEGMQKDYPELIRQLKRGRIEKYGYVDVAGLQNQIKKLEQGMSGDNCETAWLLTDLIGIELWLETFFENAHSRKSSFQSIFQTSYGGL